MTFLKIMFVGPILRLIRLSLLRCQSDLKAHFWFCGHGVEDSYDLEPKMTWQMHESMRDSIPTYSKMIRID